MTRRDETYASSQAPVEYAVQMVFNIVQPRAAGERLALKRRVNDEA